MIDPHYSAPADEWTQEMARIAQRRNLRLRREARRERFFGIAVTIVLSWLIAAAIIRGAVILWQVWGVI